MDDKDRASEGALEQLTQAVVLASSGERVKLNMLLNEVYEELRGMARRQMASERLDHTLQATALVHEAYIRLVSQRNIDYANRNEFFAAASSIIRRLLVDHARTKGRAKRGGNAERITLDFAECAANHRTVDVLDLEDALQRLSAMSERAARVVEMRFFGGLGMREISELLEVSLATVNNDWAVSKAWLGKELLP